MELLSPDISSFRCAQVCGIPSLVSWEVWGPLDEVLSLLHDTYLGMHSKRDIRLHAFTQLGDENSCSRLRFWEGVFLHLLSLPPL